MNATPTESRSRPPDGRLRFRIGSVGISVDSALDEALEDLAVLYGDSVDSRASSDPTIQMEIRPGRRWPLGGRRYAIWGDGEELFTNRRRNEVLPYLEWGINWRVIAARTEFLQLHSAVLAYNGQAVILVGASGSGKSTLAAGLLARGWSYLSDEFALIDPDTLLVHPFPKALCVKAGSFDTVERLKLPIWRRRHYVKAFKGHVGYISTRSIARQVQTTPRPVRFVLFPKYAEGTEARLLSIPRARAAFLLTQNVLNRHAVGGRAISVLSDVVRDAQCLRLESGALDETCDLVESLVSSGRAPAEAVAAS